MSITMMGRNMSNTNRRKPMTKERIVNIAKCQGSFTTTPQWRNDKIRKWCWELVDEGVLRTSPQYHKYKNIEFVIDTKIIKESGDK